jgi:hypothetical protein
MRRVEQTAQSNTDAGSGAILGRARLGIVAGVLMVIAGALYLMAVRGEALLLDLSQLAGRVWCF